MTDMLYTAFPENNNVIQDTGIIMKADTSKPLKEHVSNSIFNYLNNPANSEINGLYQLVLSEVEEPLLKRVMQYTHGNQSKAAKVMGINRSTLRRMLKKHNLYF